MFSSTVFFRVQIRCRFHKKGILLENKSKFVSLKRILAIISLCLMLATYSDAQENRGPGDGGKLVKLYPNPATTSYVTFEIQRNYQKGLSIAIYNFLGKKVNETPNVGEKTTVALADFNRGMYIYHLTDASGKVIETGKFQVSR